MATRVSALRKRGDSHKEGNPGEKTPERIVESPGGGGYKRKKRGTERKKTKKEKGV